MTDLAKLIEETCSSMHKAIHCRDQAPETGASHHFTHLIAGVIKKSKSKQPDCAYCQCHYYKPGFVLKHSKLERLD